MYSLVAQRVADHETDSDVVATVHAMRLLRHIADRRSLHDETKGFVWPHLCYTPPPRDAAICRSTAQTCGKSSAKVNVELASRIRSCVSGADCATRYKF